MGAATERNFDGPIQTIIPWAGNYYTQTLIERVRAEMGADFWGFWMLGGMSGGGMGFIFSPERKAAAQDRLAAIMSETKRAIECAVPFAMEPVVYDFSINEHGTRADLVTGECALMPPGYYTLTVPALLRTDPRLLSPLRRAELDRFTAACRTSPELSGMVQTLFDHLLPRGKQGAADDSETLETLLERYGFDRAQHQQIQADLRAGRIGLSQNRLPASQHHRRRAPGGRDRRARRTARALAPPRHGSARRRRRGRGFARRRRRQPLDQGRRRGEGAQPVRPRGRPPPQLHRGPPGQEPPRLAARRRGPSPRHHHQLPHA